MPSSLMVLCEMTVPFEILSGCQSSHRRRSRGGAQYDRLGVVSGECDAAVEQRLTAVALAGRILSAVHLSPGNPGHRSKRLGRVPCRWRGPPAPCAAPGLRVQPGRPQDRPSVYLSVMLVVCVVPSLALTRRLQEPLASPSVDRLYL